MREFNYIAKNKEGDVVKGLVEAENDKTAAKLLSGKELVAIDIIPKREASFNFSRKISVKEKALFARQLATMINAGLPISQSLITLKDQSSNLELKKIVDTVSKDIEGGSQLSSSFSKFPKLFKQIDLSLIATGEASGTLDKVLLRLADQTEKTYRINKKIRSAFTYPAFIIVVIIGVVVLMVLYVMPQMENLYKSFDADLPFLTRMMIGLSYVLRRFGILVALALFGFFVLLKRFVSTTNGRKLWDSLKLKIPIIGNFLQKVYVARFSRTLAGMVNSGVPLLDSLKIVSDSVGNVVFRDIIMDAREKVKGGIPLSTPLKENVYFPLLVSQMIGVGEKTGELDNMLDNLADYYEEEVDNIVKNLSTLIEPIIIVVMGLMVGTLLVAILQPIYGLSNVIFK